VDQRGQRAAEGIAFLNLAKEGIEATVIVLPDESSGGSVVAVMVE